MDNPIVKKLVNAYATLVLAEEMTLEEVPETYVLGGKTYPLRELVDLEVSRRIIEGLNPSKA